MERKYWVPALERGHEVLACIACHPSKLRLIDLCAATGINKSTMFSLLHTMESLEWVKREKGDTYVLGSTFAYLGNAYFSNIDVVKLFMQHAAAAVAVVGETAQLARLEGEHVVYLAKVEAPTPVRLLSEPGRRIPAYTTALGKVLLAARGDAEVKRLYRDQAFLPLTSNTLKDMNELLLLLPRIREQGYAEDLEELAAGFCCLAVPVTDVFGRVLAAASFSIPTGQWDSKKELARDELSRLSGQLSSLL
ncbi:IclR family transcriptional regulator [Paenibacillus guangzhouensis]|uniref:IclR family transcriptional regulator n=1 Tax=Paenibacillus guangzhouensis TaxID=1473112 RepID=UPI001266C9BB|nr:IclR family transcriptional regulator [Paenibacillus guangzhouensis]